jgi:carbamate kinase
MGAQLIVLAIGGNSLIRDEAHRTVPDQWALTRDTCRRIAPLLEAGHRLVITHGNGPQVGFILRRSELARHELHEVPLDSCGADTQGAIGYMIQLSLGNELAARGVTRPVVSLVTLVEVDASAPAALKPSKPIGSFMDAGTAQARARVLGWTVAEDAGRGWRRVVPSPPPVAILELEAVRTLLDAGFVVVAAGGGGIPVVRGPEGELRGIEAVIDKDETSSLLATALEADLLLISTAVERVCLEYGTSAEEPLDRLSLVEARRYLEEGQFGAGSMAPKIHAAIAFLEHGGPRVIITSPERLEDAVAGRAGTAIVR